MLDEVRRPLLDEARRSPSLLSDLAGLEEYVAESYDARSFVELLQNADDAAASRFVIQRCGDLLIVANDGRRFTRSDFESLCRSAASSKSRGTSIGYRGIGFKSVVSFARTIHLVSGELATTFSRERTAKDVPQATRVPLVRIPHCLDTADRARFATALDRLLGGGLTTAFIFDHLLAGGIEKEFAAFDPSSLLFLRNVRHVEFRANTEAVITVRRDTMDARTHSIHLASAEGNSRWLVIGQNGMAVAFGRDANGVIRLSERDAVVHAFLPTLEPTGLAVKIHGDISTDPSRTRVVFDERTGGGLSEIAELIVSLLEEGLSGRELPDAAGVIAALVPFSDPRMASFQRRCFKTELFAALQRSARERFSSLRCRPTWLNAVDYSTLARVAHLRVVPRGLEEIEGLHGLLRFLGAKEATLDELAPALGESGVTVPGAAELVGHLAQRHTTKQMDPKQIDRGWRLWPLGGKVLSFAEAKGAGGPLDRDFTDLVQERLGMGTELRRLVAAMSDAPTAAKLLPDEPASANGGQSDLTVAGAMGISPPDGAQTQKLSLKRWRSAEQQVLSLLAASGWRVEDVSQQNVGYDIEGRTPAGEDAFVEVKAIDCPGQPFTLTSNEEAVARQKGNKYLLAIVRQADGFLEVAFIRDPLQHLKLTRQCRQWVWECAEYAFRPQRFPLE